MTDRYDYTPLTRRMPWREVAAANPGLLRDALAGVGVVLASVAYLAWYSLAETPLDGGFLEDLLSIVGGIFLVVALVGAVIGILLALHPFAARRSLRIKLFAAENGFAYRAHGESPPPVGYVFGQSLRAAVTDQLRSASTVRGYTASKPVTVTLASAVLHAEKTTKGGSARGEVGYVHVALTESSPHYVLDATSNNRFGTEKMAFRASQRLSLEGDFDRHFALYCPPGHERDALQLFTPDVMALLIDHGRAWDVEIIGDNLFVYSRRKLRLFDAGEMRRLLTFVERVVPKLGGRVERIGWVEPAPDGRMLRTRRRWPVALLVLFGSLALLVAYFSYVAAL